MPRALVSALLALSFAGLAGCTHAPAAVRLQLEQTQTRYQAIVRGLDRTEVERRLGAPTRLAEEGSAIWEFRYDAYNFVSLQVWFDAAGQVSKAQTTRARGHAGDNLKTQSVITTDNP